MLFILIINGNPSYFFSCLLSFFIGIHYHKLLIKNSPIQFYSIPLILLFRGNPSFLYLLKVTSANFHISDNPFIYTY